MTLSEGFDVAIVATLTGVLGWAAIVDFRVRQIPNAVVLSILALFAAWSFLHSAGELGSALLAGALCFIVTFGLYRLKIIGAGDAKLFSALALFANFSHLSIFVLWTAVVGAGLALLDIAARRRLSARENPARTSNRRGIPYGIAIAIAGAASAWLGVSDTMPPPP